jgi:hypothetical protein
MAIGDRRGGDQARIAAPLRKVWPELSALRERKKKSADQLKILVNANFRFLDSVLPGQCAGHPPLNRASNQKRRWP